MSVENNAAMPAAVEGNANTEVSSGTSGASSAAGSGGTAPAKSSTQVEKPASAVANSGGTSADAGEESTPAYAPSYDFLVDQQKKEVPDWARGLIKDAATEKQVKDIFQKAEGLDAAKPRHESTKARLADVETKYNGLASTLAEVSGFVKNKDYDSFFEAVGVPQAEVLQYALQLVQRDKWTPEQRQEWSQARTTQQRARILERENATLSQQHNEGLVRQRGTEVDFVLSRPEIAPHANAYDARVGRQGAFRDEVWNRGVALSSQSGKDVSASDAVTSFLQLLGIDPNAQPGVQTLTPNQIAIPGKPAPVIPNVNGRAAAATRKKPTSIADLKKLASEARD